MTQQDKDLLLRDLSARLPYGVKININGEEDTLLELGVDTGWINASYDIDDVRPYLRSLSNMTEEEYEEYYNISYGMNNIGSKYKYYDLCDWFNKHHFDYRGLIEKGLALEAPEGMYNLNK